MGAEPVDKKARPAMTYQRVGFNDLPGWQADDHRTAYAAFLNSCHRLVQMARGIKDTAQVASQAPKMLPDEKLLPLCTTAQMLPGKPSNIEARNFFERYFVPHRVAHNGAIGLLTGYYEPVIEGSRLPDARFKAPVYKRPGDLVNLVEESQRGAQDGSMTHGRQTTAGISPYPTRADIDQGILKNKGLELLFLEDPVDVFFMQIQGSGRIKLPDGSMIRIGYDGKNGHPYTSIGRILIDQGEIPVERMSLTALAHWLKANAAKARDLMWANKSYVFFREYRGKESGSPQGVHEIPLTPGRSLAIDAGYHAIGLPVYVVAPQLTHAGSKTADAKANGGPAGFHRLMIAQDVGSAIKGPERGDIYFGSGDKAGKLAGVTKHPGNLFVLLPKSEAGDPPDAQKPQAKAGAGTLAPPSKAKP